MSRKEKPNPILFLFVIKIIITPCLVNNNVKKKAAKPALSPYMEMIISLKIKSI